MSDTQAAMREFRFLDDKRKGGGLAPLEEDRWIELGGQLGMSAQQGYYGEDGLWYAYPPGYDPHTGQYYGQQQPYYDPNAGYYPPQQQQGYDPNAGYYDPNAQYDPNQAQEQWDPNAQAYAPQQPAPYPSAPQWPTPSAPQAQWPQSYDPNTGQYYNQGFVPPAPSAPPYVPPPPSVPYVPPAQQWQRPSAPRVPPAPTWAPPPPAAVVPAAAEEDPLLEIPEQDGPTQIDEDEVMEVTDDDVTLLDSSPPVSTPQPRSAAPRVTFDAEKPLTKTKPAGAPAPKADLLGDLKSSLSFDEPEAAKVESVGSMLPDLPPFRAPKPAAAAVPEPSMLPDLPPFPDPIAAAPRLAIAEPVLDIPEEPAVAAAEPLLDIPEEPAVAAAEPLLELPEEPAVAAAEPLLDIPEEPAVTATEPVLDLPAEPALDLPEEPAVAAEPLLDIPEEPAPVAAEPLLDIPEEPTPVAVAPDPVLDLAEEPAPVAAAAEPLLDIHEEPAVAAEPLLDIAAEPVPVAVAPAPVLDIAEEPAAVAVDMDDEPVDLTDEPAPPATLAAAEPAIAVDLDEPEPIAAAPAADVDVSFEPEIDETVPDVPSIMVADDLGAETFAAPVRKLPVFDEPELPPMSQLSAMLGHTPPAPPPPPEPEPESLAIPDPRPSTPLPIQVEEPEEADAFLDDPILEGNDPAPFMPAAAPAAQAFEASFDDIPVAHEPEPPPAKGTGFEASLEDLPPAIANEPPPPIVDVLELAPTSAPAMDFDVAIDDKPLPVEVPLDLGGSSDDKVELAKTSDFLSFPTASTTDTSSFSGDGESLVESGTLANLANPTTAAPSAGPAPIELPPEEPDMGVPLANNADFLGMPALNNTGEAWSKQSTGLELDTSSEEEEDIIQGEVLEDDPLDAEITADLAEPEMEANPWPAPLAIPPPAPTPAPRAAPAPVAVAPPPARPLAPAPVSAPPRPPAPVAMAPLPPRPAAPAAAPLGPLASSVPAAPVRQASSAPFEAAADHSLFAPKGKLLHEDALQISGEHRVILHTIEGQVKRGVLRDTKLGDETVCLEAAPGSMERIPRPRVKAIFFMLPPGQKAPAPSGDKLRVTFKDGRQLAGFSSDHKNKEIGFFVVPADNRTNTERIFIYRASIDKIAVD